MAQVTALDGTDLPAQQPQGQEDGSSTRPSRAVAWLTASLAGRQLVQLLTVAALAWFLTPADFGVVAMALVVTGFLTAVRDAGLGAAIVRHVAPTQRSLSLVFWTSSAIGASICLLVLIVAPLVAEIFRQPPLADLLRVMAFGFLAGGLGTAHQALAERRLQFAALARIELVGTIMGSVVALSAAWTGMGAMSFALQFVTTICATVIGLWLKLGWRPSSQLAVTELRPLLSFGIPLAASNALNYVVRSSDYLVIGLVLGAEQLGYYALAYRLALAPIQVLNAALSRVLLPIYSRSRDDLEKLRSTYLRSTAYVAFLGLPICLGTTALASLLIEVGFGEQWRPAGAVLGVLGVVAGGQIVGATVGPIYLAMGRSVLYLAVGFVSAGVLLTSFVVGVQFGIVGVALAYTVASLALLVPSLLIPYRLVDLPIGAIVRAVGSSAVCAAVMAVAVWLTVDSLPAIPVVVLGAIFQGVAMYLTMSLILNRHAFLST